jgi:hypothetical protein
MYQIPDVSLTRLFCTTWRKLSSHYRGSTTTSIHKVFENLIKLLTKTLSFRSVFIFIDGVDSFPELYQSPSFAARSLRELFSQASDWDSLGVFLKGFLPLEMHQPLQKGLEEKLEFYRLTELRWDVDNLKEMIQKRIYAAVNGKFDSLNAVSDSLVALNDIEITLAKAVAPLPREMLRIVQRVLYEYQHRQNIPGASKLIMQEDVENALRWYPPQKTLVATKPKS